MDHGGSAFRLDWLGLALAPTGLALVTYGLSESASDTSLGRPVVVADFEFIPLG